MFLLYFQLFGSDKQCLIVAENGNSRLQISAPWRESSAEEVPMTELRSRWGGVGCAVVLLTLAAMLGCQGMNLAKAPASLGNGTSPSQVSVSPATVNFGTVVVGTARSQTGTLSTGNASITVSSATLSSPEFALSGLSFPLTVAGGQSVSFTVAFTPKTTGAAAGNLSFVSDGNTPTVVYLTGTGTAAPQHNVDLSWNASTSQVVGYNVYRGTWEGDAPDLGC